MMLFKPETISLPFIDIEDRTFKITTDRPLDDLLASIRAVGLLSPPVLRRKSEKYAIISGFRRVSACRRLGWNRVDARVVPSDTGSRECLSIAIADNTANRRLNLIEQAIAVSRLSVYYPDDNDLSRVAARLGMAMSSALIPKLKRLCRLPEQIQGGVLAGTIPLTVALELGDLDIGSALAFARLFESLKPTLNHQKNILTLAREIALIGDMSIPSLIQDDPVSSIIQNPDLSQNQKVTRLIEVLKRLRYPEISRFKDTFHRRVRSLDLPGPVRILPPKHFEGKTYTITFDFQTLAGIKASLKRLSAAVERPEFAAILEKEIADY